jgi:hypothetical protein
VKVAPFTLEQTTITYRNGAPSVTEIRTTGRRADNSKAIFGVFPNSPSKPPLRRVDFADGRSLSLIDPLKARMSIWRDEAQRAAEKRRIESPPENCLYFGERMEGTEKLLDLDVIVVQKDLPDGRLFSERRAPRLQCFALAMKLEERKGSAFIPVLEVRPNFISLAEPAALLFDESPSSRETAPSELKREVYRAIGVTEATCPTCFESASDIEQDRLYREKRVAGN